MKKSELRQIIREEIQDLIEKKQSVESSVTFDSTKARKLIIDFMKKWNIYHKVKGDTVWFNEAPLLKNPKIKKSITALAKKLVNIDGWVGVEDVLYIHDAKLDAWARKAGIYEF